MTLLTFIGILIVLFLIHRPTYILPVLLFVGGSYLLYWGSIVGIVYFQNASDRANAQKTTYSSSISRADTTNYSSILDSVYCQSFPLRWQSSCKEGLTELRNNGKSDEQIYKDLLHTNIINADGTLTATSLAKLNTAHNTPTPTIMFPTGGFGSTGDLKIE